MHLARVQSRFIADAMTSTAITTFAGRRDLDLYKRFCSGLGMHKRNFYNCTCARMNAICIMQWANIIRFRWLLCFPSIKIVFCFSSLWHYFDLDIWNRFGWRLAMISSYKCMTIVWNNFGCHFLKIIYTMIIMYVQNDTVLSKPVDRDLSFDDRVISNWYLLHEPYLKISKTWSKYSLCHQI